MAPFKVHGKIAHDSALYPWQMGSIARAIFFFCQTLETPSLTFQAIAGYYSLFHLTIFLMLGCPQLLSDELREKIDAGINDGNRDPSPQIRHADAMKFLKNSKGIAPDILLAFSEFLKAREFINYAPRITWPKDQDIYVNSCEIDPASLPKLAGRLEVIFQDVVKWACDNAIDHGVWLPHIFEHIENFFKPRGYYSKWLSPALMFKADAFRIDLLKISEAGVKKNLRSKNP